VGSGLLDSGKSGVIVFLVLVLTSDDVVAFDASDVTNEVAVESAGLALDRDHCADMLKVATALAVVL